MTMSSLQFEPIETAPPSQRYFMDDPREAQRLADKVDANKWVTRYIAPYLRADSCVLDVGSGPGVLAAEMAERCPLGRVVALDQSPVRSREAGQRLAPWGGYSVAGSAVALPFEDGSFDLVYCRFLLEYLREPERAVREMVRVCRPGGRVLLQDLDGQMLWNYPQDAELEHGINATLAALGKTGFDPCARRKLYHHCYNAGLSTLSSQVEVYHHYAGAIDAENGRLWELKFDIALPAAIAALGSEEKARALKQRFLRYLERPDTFTYSNLVTVTGVR